MAKSIIYTTSVRFKRNIFLTFFLLSALCVLTLLIMLVREQFPDHPVNLPLGLEIQKNALSFFIAFIGAIISAVIAIFLSVIFDLPSLFMKFDDIKNAVAHRQIGDSVKLAERMNAFFVQNLQYTFLSVEYSLIKILKHPIQFSDVAISRHFNASDLEAMEKKGRESESVSRYRDLEINGKAKHTYIVPIHFADQYLGFWLVVTTSRILKPFLDFLADIEDHLIDDQVMHALNYEKMSLQRDLYIQIDRFSDKVTLGEYRSLDTYLKDVLRLTVDMCNASAGIFWTVYDDTPVSYCRTDINDVEQQGLLEAAIRFRPHQPKTKRVPEHGNRYIFALPVMIRELRGFVYIIDNSESSLEYYGQMLQDLENLKLDNDLEHLAEKLGLSARSSLS